MILFWIYIYILCVYVLSVWAQRMCSVSHVWLFVTSWTVVHSAPLSITFFRQEYRSEVPFPLPGELLNPGIELVSSVTPALAGGFFITETPGKLCEYIRLHKMKCIININFTYFFVVLKLLLGKNSHMWFILYFYLTELL